MRTSNSKEVHVHIGGNENEKILADLYKDKTCRHIKPKETQQEIIRDFDSSSSSYFTVNSNVLC